MTSISASSAVCTINGLADTTNVRVHDPVYVNGASISSDVDLNTSGFDNPSYFHVTSKTSTTITYACPNVANSAGYTESTIRVEMANSFASGAGIDAKIPYPFDQIRRAMGNFASTANLAFNKYLDDRVIPSHYTMPDWAFGYLPNVHPLDAVPEADYFNSTPYLKYQTMYTSTPGNYASFIANYNSTDGINDMLYAGNYYGRDYDNPGSLVQNIPTTTKWIQYRSLGAGIANNSQAIDMRYSVQQLGMVEQFTLATKFGAIAMSYQRNVARSGAPTAGMGCYNWELPAEKVSFNMLAPHKSKSVSLDGTISSQFDSYVNAWYRHTLWSNAGSCVCTPDTCIDSNYILAFDQSGMGKARPTGYEGWLLDSIGSTQKGRMKSDLAFHNSPSYAGQDWSLPIQNTVIPMFLDYGTYWWFTAARFVELMGIHVENQLTLMTSRTAGYWQTTISNSPQSHTCETPLRYADVNQSACDGFRVNLLTYTQYLGPANSNVVAYKAAAAAIVPGHDFDEETNSATQADAGNTNTPSCTGCGTTGSHTATFTFSTSGGQFGCPFVPGSQTVMSVISGSTDTSYSDVAFASGGTCASVGGTGTITYTLLYAHSGTYHVDYGCGTARPQPNYIVNGQTYRLPRCSVQF